MTGLRWSSRKSYVTMFGIESFAEECLVKDANAYALKFDAYMIYHNFCMVNGLLPRNIRIFHSTLKSLIPSLEESRRRIGKEEHNFYLGVKLNMKNPIVRKFNPTKLRQEGQTN